MNKRRVIPYAFLFAGWLLGYGFHYYSAERTFKDLSFERELMSIELAELRKILPVRKKVSVKATAYSNDPYSINVPRWRDGMTATNKRARRGYVAADWSIFPPGTRLYIPGYGEAVVEDKGGLVRGNHLDLFVDSRKEALEWGIKELEVYILDGRT